MSKLGWAYEAYKATAAEIERAAHDDTVSWEAWDRLLEREEERRDRLVDAICEATDITENDAYQMVYPNNADKLAEIVARAAAQG